jgi:hypothetical protein
LRIFFFHNVGNQCPDTDWSNGWFVNILSIVNILLFLPVYWGNN